jgi:hypothetical protein
MSKIPYMEDNDELLIDDDLFEDVNRETLIPLQSEFKPHEMSALLKRVNTN